MLKTRKNLKNLKTYFKKPKFLRALKTCIFGGKGFSGAIFVFWHAQTCPH